MRERVLVIDDNPINLELMEYLLRAFGFEVATADSGEAGLQALRQHRPALVLCDIQMPGMDGLALADAVMADPALRDVPLVAVTAYAMVGDRERVMAHGFRGYVTKPIDPQGFLATVQAHLAAPVGAPARTPLAAGSVPAQAAPRPASPPSSARVLVLDDTPANLVLKRSLLEPMGYEVITTSTIEQAIAAARAHRPDVIISDVGLQPGSGFDFIRRVKADEGLRDVPFLFITSTHWNEASRREGLALGADRYLMRPLEPQQVLDAVRDCLRR